jgi:protein-disulfide isomerase
MNKTFIWIGLILIVAFLLMMSGRGGPKMDIPFEVGVLHPLDNTKGNLEASVVVMEYSDFQCPACRSYYPMVRQLITEFEDRAIFVFRHFPLLSIHPNAEFAARAAEAAGQQDRFWEMHDILYEKQNEWARVANVTPLFESYATLLALDLEKFKTDFSSDTVKDFVRAQRIHAVQSGLQGTPSFFVDGEQIRNPGSYDEFRSIILQALNK